MKMFAVPIECVLCSMHQMLYLYACNVYTIYNILFSAVFFLSRMIIKANEL